MRKTTTDDLFDAIKKNPHSTVRELMAAIGIKGSATIQHHLDILEGEGKIRRNPRKARSIELVKETSDDRSPLRPAHPVPDCPDRQALAGAVGTRSYDMSALDETYTRPEAVRRIKAYRDVHNCSLGEAIEALTRQVQGRGIITSERVRDAVHVMHAYARGELPAGDLRMELEEAIEEAYGGLIDCDIESDQPPPMKGKAL